VSLAHTPDNIRFTREAWASALEGLVGRQLHALSGPLSYSAAVPLFGRKFPC
jgi:hypothetical protein